MQRKWLDNAFWSDNSKDRNHVTAILETTDDNGKKTNQVVRIGKINPEGNENPDFKEIVEQLGVDLIDGNTRERRRRKEEEQVAERQKREENQRARNLEELFNAKLKAFEIDYVKNCKDRILKSKLRKSRNVMEVTAWTSLIMMKEFENEQSATES